MIARTVEAPWIEAQDTIRAPDTGPTPPALHAADYEQYRKAGGATITGVLRITLPNGMQIPCRFGFSNEAFLFPDTEYTEWAIERWTTLVDHHRFTGAGGPEFFPGQNDRRIPMPSYLDVGRDGIVGDSKCEEDGRFTFRDVSNGKYIIIGSAGIDSLGSSPGDENVSQGYGAQGPVELITQGQGSTRIIPGQQWIIVSSGSIEVDKAEAYVVRLTAFHPAATYFYKNE